jgi:N-acetyl-anhydromuramyl-L-alanine amidase AmpD
MTLYSDYIRAVFDDKTWPNRLKPGILAWSMLESGRCTTDVSKYAYNAHSMMWRAELGALYPNKYRFEGNDYFRFIGLKQELECLWKFLHRSVYGNIDPHMSSIEDLLTSKTPSGKTVGATFCPPGYQDWWIARHLNCNYHQYIVKWMLPEAEDTLKILGWRPDMDQPAPVPAPVPEPVPQPAEKYNLRNGLLYLGNNLVPQFQSPYYSKWVKNEVKYCIHHFTGDIGVSGLINYMLKNSAQACPHFLLPQGGGIVQLVPVNRPAWAAGSPLWNNQSINFEWEGFGFMSFAIGNTTYISKWGPYGPRIKTVPVADCLYAAHKKEPRTWRYWPYFSDAQYNTYNLVKPALEAEYGKLGDKGHEEVCQDRLDPGPAFRWSSFEAGGVNRHA